MRKRGSIVYKIRPCLTKGPTITARMRTTVAVELQRQYCKRNLFCGYGANIPQEQGGLVIPPGTGFHSVASYDSQAGPRWRYLNALPYGMLLKL
jgi:hypothetical protein